MVCHIKHIFFTSLSTHCINLNSIRPYSTRSCVYFKCTETRLLLSCCHIHTVTIGCHCPLRYFVQHFDSSCVYLTSTSASVTCYPSYHIKQCCPMFQNNHPIKICHILLTRKVNLFYPYITFCVSEKKFEFHHYGSRKRSTINLI